MENINFPKIFLKKVIKIFQIYFQNTFNHKLLDMKKKLNLHNLFLNLFHLLRIIDLISLLYLN